MSNAKRTINITQDKRVEGNADPVVVYSGAIILDKPAVGEPVTLADVQQLLADTATENAIPLTALVVEGTTLNLRWTDADLTP